MQKQQNTKTSQIKQIKSEIARLHKKGSGDWKSLKRQVSQNFKPIKLNLMQIMIELVRHKELYIEAGRGAGKSTGLSQKMNRTINAMPRSKNIFLTPTYQKALTETLPGIIFGLEMQGIFKDLHYFVGRRPPKNWKWKLPYQPPEKFDNIISFWNGACYQLVSQDVKGSARGLNADSLIADEAAMLDKAKIDAETVPTMRGSNHQAFKNNPFYRRYMYVSTTPITPEGYWFVEQEDKAVEFPNKIKFLSATCEVNKHNLPKDYLDDARMSTLPYIFDAEYLNIRTNQIKDGFYPLLDKKCHSYTAFDYTYYTQLNQEKDCRGDQDLIKSLPLILGIDWGARINCLAICQHNASRKELRALKSMYVLGEQKKIQSDLFKQFNEYYRHHPNKRIYLWYDNTGNNKTGITRRTRAEMARDQLRALGWKVQLMTVGGSNPRHDAKHLLWEKVLKEDQHHLPKFRINYDNARELWISMKQAKAKMSRNNTVQKDKSSERSKVIKPQHATDLSDAMDHILFGMFYKQLQYGGSMLPK